MSKDSYHGFNSYGWVIACIIHELVERNIATVYYISVDLRLKSKELTYINYD